MLTACIKSERLKLKHSHMFFAFLLIPVIPAVMGVQNYLQNLALLKSEWYSLWTQITLFYSDFFFAPLIAIYCSYLWRLENQGKNRYMLFTAPVRIRDIFLGKMFSITRITVFTQVWMYLLFTISGKLAGLPALPPVQTLYYILRGMLGALVIAAMQLVLSMIIRSFAAPIAIAVTGAVTGLLASNSKYAILYPYSLLMLGMNSNKSEDTLVGDNAAFFLVSIFYLLLFCTAAVWILKHQDVKT